MRVCRDRGLGPSIAVFEPGFLRGRARVPAAGALPRGHAREVLLLGGRVSRRRRPAVGHAADPEALDVYLAMLGDAPIPWAVAVLGGSLLDAPVARARTRTRRPPPRRPRGLGRRARERRTGRRRGRARREGGPPGRDHRRGRGRPRVAMTTRTTTRPSSGVSSTRSAPATSPARPRASTPSATTRTRGRATSPSPGRR